MTWPAMVRVIRSAGKRSRLPALLLLTLLLLVPAVASGHAELIGIEPLDGERLETPPSTVTLTFNEPVGLAPGGLRILAATGDEVDDGPELVDGAVVSQPLGPLSDGWYVATWGVVSEDGHIIRSASAFAVGEVTSEARPDAAAIGLGEASSAMRALTDIAVLIAAGAWAAWWLFGARARVVRRLATGAMAVALAATVAWSLIGWLDGGATWLESPSGTAAIARGVLLLVGLAAATRATLVAALAAGGALLTMLGGGHAAGSPVDLALQAAHLVAAAVWLGAAPAVLIVLRDPATTDEASLRVARAFSRAAAVALVIVAAAGAALTWQLSDGLAAGLMDPWIVTLGAKLLVVAGAVALGAWGRRHLAGDPRRGRVSRLFAVDAVILIVVATLSSMLTLHSPDATRAGHGGSGDRCAMTVGETAVSIIVSPGLSGSNVARIDGLPPGVKGATLDFRHRLTAGAALATEATEVNGAWQAMVVLPLEGPWEVTLVVRVDTFSEARASCRISLAG